MTPQEYWQKYQPQPVVPRLYDEMTFGFDIIKLYTKELNGTSNVIYKVEYFIWGKYGNNDFRIWRELEFPQQVLEEQVSFVPYGEITEDMVVNWIEENTSFIHSYYSIANELDHADEVTPPLPWQS